MMMAVRDPVPDLEVDPDQEMMEMEAAPEMRVLIGVLLSLLPLSILSQSSEGELLFNTVKSNFFENNFVENSRISNDLLIESGLENDSLGWTQNYVVRSLVFNENYERALSFFEASISKDDADYREKDLYYDLLALEAWIHKKVLHPKTELLFKDLLIIIPDSIPGAKAAALNNLANYYWETGYPEKYLTRHKEALAYAIKANEPDRISRAYRNMAEYHEKISYNFDEAIALRKKAETYNETARFPETIIANNIRKAVQLRDTKNEYEAAQLLLEGAKQASIEAGLKSLYETAHVAFMRTEYLINQDRIDQRNQYIFTGALMLILFAVGAFRLYRYYYPDKEKLLNSLID
jgi:tetratricopeptide (TPR) repeat protein